MLAAQRAGIGAGEGHVAVGALGDEVQRLIHINGRALFLRNGGAEGHLILFSAGSGGHAQTHCQRSSHGKKLLHEKSSFVVFDVFVKIVGLKIALFLSHVNTFSQIF